MECRAVNCADNEKIGLVAYTDSWLKAQYAHLPNHFCFEVTINGSVVTNDVSDSEGADCVYSLGEVWNGFRKDSDGDWPS